ncbi:flavin reductase family protein [Shinella sp.]|uniref:flavin reductase family protein n=1 Tax=unclassified Shinella TaxID=2643062 RepID=UPI0028A70FDD|nr:flavin reductase family protein [Shinella sp.]
MEERQFRNALAEYATGVTIVTARTKSGEKIGMTMTSFNTVSLDPPLVLFSVGLKALSLQALREADAYVVNILARTQENLSNQFARASSDKWAGVHHTDGHKGAPRLTNAIAQFECEPHACHDGGDHLIFLGRVVNFRTSDTAAEPLLFFRGRYHSVAGPRIDVDAWPLPLHY